MNSSFNASKNNSISDKENSESKLQIQLLSNHKPKAKSMINIKYFKDISYFLFNEIFSDMEFTNIENEKIKINDYEDFYNFQKKLNSYYKSYIKFFDYKNKLNVNIVKEIPYKATRLRELHEENGAITISPNGHFVRSSEIKCESNSTLGHYNTVIANSLILKGVYYYEIKILELGNNTDMCFGIIGRNSEFMNNKRYQNFPLCEFDDCYGFNLNNHFYDKNHHYQKNIKVGTIISIKVDLNKNKIYLYFDGESTGNNSINIKNSNLGYYPAFSLSSGKEIQVRFGGIYNLFLYFKTSNQVDAKPICQYNNLENIVSIYMEIVENCLIKIMNHQQQITYNDSNRFFQPMLNFFANIAFNDEYIDGLNPLDYDDVYPEFYLIINENKRIFIETAVKINGVDLCTCGRTVFSDKESKVFYKYLDNYIKRFNGKTIDEYLLELKKYSDNMNNNNSVP